MAWTEHEFSDEALRVSLRAAAFTRAARGTAVPPRVAASSAGGEGGRAQGLDRKRPRRNDENRGAGKARRRTAPATDETTPRLFDALNKSTSKPICEGGLAHYFVTEAHRRADMTKRPDPRAASALSIPAVFDAIAAASRQEGSRPAVGDCPVCMQDAAGDSVALPCGHAFHNTQAAIKTLSTQAVSKHSAAHRLQSKHSAHRLQSKHSAHRLYQSTQQHKGCNQSTQHTGCIKALSSTQAAIKTLSTQAVSEHSAAHRLHQIQSDSTQAAIETHSTHAAHKALSTQAALKTHSAHRLYSNHTAQRLHSKHSAHRDKVYSNYSAHRLHSNHTAHRLHPNHSAHRL